MRYYGRIYTRFWTEPDIRALSRDAKLLAAYLLSGPHTTMIGCFRLPIMYACADLNWRQVEVQDALNELQQAGWITQDTAREWVNINNFLKYNRIENPNQGKAAVKLIVEVPQDSAIYAVLMQSIEAHGGAHLKPLVKGLGTPTKTPRQRVGKTVEEPSAKPFRNQEQEQKQDKEQKQKDSCATASAAPAATAVITMPLNDGTEFPITQDVIDECRKLYPALDVVQKFREMRGWLLGNQRNKKTAQGIMRFAHSWLKREQDHAPVVPERASDPRRVPKPEPVFKPSIELPGDLDANAGRVAWATVLRTLEKAINKHSFDTWLKPLKGAGVCKTTRTLFVQVPTAEFEEVAQKYGEQINAAVTALGLSAVKTFHQVEVSNG